MLSAKSRTRAASRRSCWRAARVLSGQESSDLPARRASIAASSSCTHAFGWMAVQGSHYANFAAVDLMLGAGSEVPRIIGVGTSCRVGDALVPNSSQSIHGCHERESAETLKQFGTLPRPSQPLGLRLTYAPACRKRAPTSASSLSLGGEGVSPSGLSVAFFALKTRTHRPAAQASSSSSSVHGCPHA